MANPNGRKGSSFERQTADYWRDNYDDRIDRRVKTGAKDKGDIANLRVGPHRVVLECKAERAVNLAGWIKEAHAEAQNDGALLGAVVAKRKGHGQPADQYVICTQGDFLKLLSLVATNTPSAPQACYSDAQESIPVLIPGEDKVD
jgi:hypothetical protein